MSVKLMSQVWELDLPHAKLLVALALADHGKDDGSSIYPSLGHVAWKCGYSERQVRRIVRELETGGVLVKVSDPIGARGTEYMMVTSGAPQKPPFRARRGADNMTGGVKTSGRTPTSGGGGHSDPRGADIAVSPEPSVEPSDNHQGTPDGVPVAASPPPEDLDVEIERLCRLMSSELRIAHSIAASSRECRVAKGWPGACRGLLTTDGYTARQVEYAIRWTVRHTYWRRRVKSMTRLRQEMEQIAKDIREEQDRRQPARTTGLTPEQQAREARTKERLGRLKETNPNGTNGNGYRVADGEGTRPGLASGQVA